MNFFYVILDTMIITYYGKQFFKIVQGEMVLAFNPVNKSSKSDISTGFGADIAFVTTNYPDYNGIEKLSRGDKEPFVISGPGDYEVKEIFVKGILSNSYIDGKNYINTIYSFSVDNINIVFLGALKNGDISKEAREAINEPDILFIPVGGKVDQEGLLDAKTSAKLASSLEPKMIIPMDYDDITLKAFLKEMGEDKIDAVDKLTLKRKDLEGKDGEIIVLKTA